MIKLFGYMISEIALLISLEIIGTILFIVIWYLYNRDKFNAYICEPFLNTYKIKRKIKAKLTDETFKWGDKAYKINFRNAITDDKNKPILFYDYISAEPIKPLENMGMTKGDKVIDSKTFKIGMDGEAMKHLGSRRLEKIFMYVILGLVFVILVIGVYSIYAMSQQNAEILKLSGRIINITKSLINKPIIIP